MSLRQRIDDLEEWMGDDEEITIIVGYDHPGSPCRQRPEALARRGRQVTVRRIGLMDEADTLKEAEALIAKHRESGRTLTLAVYQKGTRGTVILAE